MMDRTEIQHHTALDILAKYKIKATFFVQGKNIAGNEANSQTYVSLKVMKLEIIVGITQF